MQNKIYVLNEHTINKIAAGEVIENAASVVKELVENALDAGATSICIEIQQGGRHLIRISDNGAGMSPEDAKLCLQRHATSKIREVEDIQELSTMGFRGEAIPSIASISRFTVLTNAKEIEDAATLIKVEGGRLVSCSMAARSKGTTVEVKDLFFNVPVRRKFQKSPSYDVQAILKMVSLLALGYPHIHFELISDQKCLIKTPLIANQNNFGEQLKNRIETILGKEFAKDLSALNLQHSPYELEGYLGLPSLHKPNRSNQFLFINQRAVFSPMISAAIREGYGPMLPSQRYPVFVLHLRLPGSLIDVNVHPQKKEVRLRQEHLLKDVLIKAVQTSLQRSPMPALTDFSSYIPFEEKEIRPFKFENVQEEKWEYKPIFEDKSTTSWPSFVSEPLPEPLVEQELNLPLFTNKNPNPEVLFTFKGFMILDAISPKLSPVVKNQKEGICLLSQKNAYARLFYERLLKRSSPIQLQSLLVPLTLQFSRLEAELMKAHLARLNHIGFSIREFGEQTFLVDAYPTFLEQESIKDCVEQIIKDLLEMQTTRKLQQIKEEQLAWMASRASFRGSRRLSIEEGRLLVDQLFACEMPYQCPLGNATVIYLAEEELSKFFEK